MAPEPQTCLRLHPWSPRLHRPVEDFPTERKSAHSIMHVEPLNTVLGTTPRGSSSPTLSLNSPKTRPDSTFYLVLLATIGRYIHALGVDVSVGEGDAVGVGMVGLGVAVGNGLGVSVGAAATA